MIRFVPNDKIDKQKWDSAIDNSTSPYFYAKSWYLDKVSPRWNALIEDDYRKLMPLPVKQKWGFKYICQPILTQQLGIFSADQITQKDISHFLKSIPLSIPYTRIFLNSSNPKPKGCSF